MYEIIFVLVSSPSKIYGLKYCFHIYLHSGLIRHVRNEWRHGQEEEEKDEEEGKAGGHEKRNGYSE